MRTGPRKRNRTLTENGVRELMQLRSTGMQRRELAARFDVAVRTIDSILYGRNWTHVTGLGVSIPSHIVSNSSHSVRGNS